MAAGNPSSSRGHGSRQTLDPQLALRAYLEYFRDLGVYDFYRRSQPREWLPATIESQPLSEHIVPGTHFPAAASSAGHSHSSPDRLVAEQSGLLATESEIAKPVSLDQRLPLPAQRVPASDQPEALRQIRADIGDCTRCPLAYGGRRNIVFGDGNPSARLMFVGEGPGADEDAQGLPFVGKSGQLLNNMIAAMGLARDQVYVANIVKCRPPANRAPEPVEANTCTQFLARQIDVVQPEFIVALGATAATYLLGVRQSLASLRGHWHSVRGARALVTYHPAFLLRDPRQKVEAWKDLQLVMAAMGLMGKV